MQTIEESIADDIYRWTNNRSAENANRPMEMIYKPIEKRVDWEQVIAMSISLRNSDSPPKISSKRSFPQFSTKSSKAYSAEAAMTDVIAYRNEFSSRVDRQLRSEIDTQSLGWHQEVSRSFEPVKGFDEKAARLERALAYAPPDLVSAAFESMENIRSTERNIKGNLRAATEATTNTVKAHAEKWYNAHADGVSRIQSGHFENMGRLTENTADFMSVLNKETRNLRMIRMEGDQILRNASNVFDEILRAAVRSAARHNRPRPADDSGSQNLSNSNSGQMGIKVVDFAYVAKLPVPGTAEHIGRNTHSARSERREVKTLVAQPKTSRPRL